MLDHVTWDTAHLFGNALAEQHRLRYRVFVERAGWKVPNLNEMEWDQYDTPAAHYLIWRDEAGIARGVVRLSPTNIPWMIKDLWPELVTEMELPDSATVWEGTRLAVDPSAPARVRRRVRDELMLGIWEFGVAHGIEAFMHYTPMAFVRSVFWGNAIPTQLVGPVTPTDGIPCVTCCSPVSEEILAAVRAATGIDGSVLRTTADVLPQTQAA